MSEDEDLRRRLEQARAQSPAAPVESPPAADFRSVAQKIMAVSRERRARREAKCPDCRDTSFVFLGDDVGVRRCLACRPPAEQALEAAGIPGEKIGARLHVDVLPRNVGHAAVVAGLIEEGFGKFHGLFFSGPNGAGKSWLACAALAHAYERGWSIGYVTARDLLDEIRAVYQRDDSGAVMDIQAKYRAPRILVLNELPRGRGGRDRASKPEPVSGFEAEQIESLLNYRGDEHGNVKKTIVTGNMTYEEIEELYNRAIASRMGEACYLRLPFGGQDERRVP